MAGSWETAICNTTRIHRLHLRYRRRFLETFIHCWLFHNGCMFLFFSCSAKVFPAYWTVISLMSVVSDHSLIPRSSHSLVAYIRQREKILGIFAIVGSFIGGLGLILLSIFDTGRFRSTHRAFLLVFIIGVALSAIFTVLEVGRPIYLPLQEHFC